MGMSGSTAHSSVSSVTKVSALFPHVARQLLEEVALKYIGV